jgi:uncharacterized glyoxalase superfamily protein PhnB
MPPTMYPYLSYRDTTTALHFLQEAFGFTVSVCWDDPDGTVQHAEAAFGEGAVMMGTAEHLTAALEGSSVGQSIYVYVEDVDAHFERARAGGAPVVYPPEDTEWGTRRYRVLDPEGTSGVSATTDRARRAAREYHVGILRVGNFRELSTSY